MVCVEVQWTVFVSGADAPADPLGAALVAGVGEAATLLLDRVAYTVSVRYLVEVEWIVVVTTVVEVPVTTPAASTYVSNTTLTYTLGTGAVLGGHGRGADGRVQGDIRGGRAEAGDPGRGGDGRPDGRRGGGDRGDGADGGVDVDGGGHEHLGAAALGGTIRDGRGTVGEGHGLGVVDGGGGQGVVAPSVDFVVELAMLVVGHGVGGRHEARECGERGDDVHLGSRRRVGRQRGVDLRGVEVVCDGNGSLSFGSGESEANKGGGQLRDKHASKQASNRTPNE
ncbi:hypothetical protein Tdes44962_MAKER10359 [Teratosphaeria destructans]|uniref:Uncharacterized protein n=1 Tax=Teratosphaeria destructans TaxID=418781 RepID=A0A9W7VZ63_9PEZI|nr:hypothetical protein Tdes44962_MAKER10359 [Teratosphaeria destructans]